LRAISLHRDVIVVTSRLLQTNCTIVRGPVSADGHEAEDAAPSGETFVVDSPILPDELALLPSLLEQARLPPPGGLLATHADWDHLLGRIPFPEATLGCAESSAVRLQAEPGAAQRELRAFDERLYLVRDRPLQLGAVQALPVPGSCGIGDGQLELYPAEGHTPDGMALWVPWAQVLVVGDYLSSIEIPTVSAREGIDSYLATLERLRPLVARAEHVVPGHGPVLDAQRALSVLAEDAAYLQGLLDRGSAAELPRGRRSPAQRELHAGNVGAASSPPGS
jgi:glyoxylase-like metal-dependent hydrolase (beta-lactamase superfamily II)